MGIGASPERKRSFESQARTKRTSEQIDGEREGEFR